jgi:hypothetical protein
VTHIGLWHAGVNTLTSARDAAIATPEKLLDWVTNDETGTGTGMLMDPVRPERPALGTKAHAEVRGGVAGAPFLELLAEKVAFRGARSRSKIGAHIWALQKGRQPSRLG